MGQDLISDPEAVAALHRADALHTALTHIVLEGGDLAAIAEAVGDALGCGVVFTSTDGRERAAHLDEAQRDALADADLLDPTRSPAGRADRPRRHRRRQGRGARTPRGGGRRRPRAARGAATRRHDPLLRRARARAGGDRGRAAGDAPVEAITAVENKYRGDFLRDVFLGRAGEEVYVAEHAQAFGWQLDRPVMVVVAVLDPDAIAALAPGPEERRAWQDRFAHAWRQVAATVDESIASVDFSQRGRHPRAGRPRRGRRRRPRGRRPHHRGRARRPRRRPDRVLRRRQPGRPRPQRAARRPSGRRSAPSRSVAGSTAADRSPASTSSACTGCWPWCRTAPS